jgi:hypothetical protein
MTSDMGAALEKVGGLTDLQQEYLMARAEAEVEPDKLSGVQQRIPRWGEKGKHIVEKKKGKAKHIVGSSSGKRKGKDVVREPEQSSPPEASMARAAFDTDVLRQTAQPVAQRDTNSFYASGSDLAAALNDISLSPMDVDVAGNNAFLRSLDPTTSCDTPAPVAEASSQKHNEISDSFFEQIANNVLKRERLTEKMAAALKEAGDYSIKQALKLTRAAERLEEEGKLTDNDYCHPEVQNKPCHSWQGLTQRMGATARYVPNTIRATATIAFAVSSETVS